jgi:excisionase family DNA binding protein
MPKAVPDGYLTAAKAAEKAGVTRDTIFRWIREKRLRRYRLAGIRDTLVKVDELERWLTVQAE